MAVFSRRFLGPILPQVAFLCLSSGRDGLVVSWVLHSNIVAVRHLLIVLRQFLLGSLGMWGLLGVLLNIVVSLIAQLQQIGHRLVVEHNNSVVAWHGTEEIAAGIDVKTHRNLSLGVRVIVALHQL